MLTPRTAAWTVLRPLERRGSEDEVLAAKLRVTSSALATAVELAEEFAALVHGRKPKRLDLRPQRSQDSAVPALQRFAKRPSLGYDAVRAAVTLA